MKKIFILILISFFTITLLCGCNDTPAQVKREVVKAIVIDSGTSRGGQWIQVAYNGAITTWDNDELYKYYNSRHGAYVKCVLVTYTYKSGKIKRELLYNKDMEQEYRNSWTEVR